MVGKSPCKTVMYICAIPTIVIDLSTNLAQYFVLSEDEHIKVAPCDKVHDQHNLLCRCS